MHRTRGGPAPYVAWARQGLCSWKQARKHVIKRYRDGRPINWLVDHYQVSRQWLWKWIHRWEAGNKHWSALEDHSSRPHTIHRKRDAWVAKVLEAKKRWPYIGAIKLRHLTKIPLSHTTIHKILQEHEKVRKTPRKQRSWKRFCRPFSNYLWQIDTTYVKTTKGWRFVQTLLDDHSRYIIASRVLEAAPNQADTIQTVQTAVRQWGAPLQILSDNGAEFAHGTREEPGLFTRWCLQQGIRHIRGRPNHPRTQGKIERWHRSLKHEWLYRHPKPDSTTTLQAIILGYLEHYNHERPHTALSNRTPGEIHLASLMLSPHLTRAVNEVP